MYKTSQSDKYIRYMVHSPVVNITISRLRDDILFYSYLKESILARNVNELKCYY